MKRLYFLIFAIALVVGFGAYLVVSNSVRFSATTNTDKLIANYPDSENKTYVSDLFKLSLSIPKSMTIQEKLTVINFRDNKGDISLTKIGTEHERISDYIEYSNKINSLRVIQTNNGIIDSYNSISQLIETNESKRYYSYSIKVKDVIYGLSTSSPELYDELDQIAQSFRYTGD